MCLFNYAPVSVLFMTVPVLYLALPFYPWVSFFLGVIEWANVLLYKQILRQGTKHKWTFDEEIFSKNCYEQREVQNTFIYAVQVYL